MTTIRNYIYLVKVKASASLLKYDLFSVGRFIQYFQLEQEELGQTKRHSAQLSAERFQRTFAPATLYIFNLKPYGSRLNFVHAGTTVYFKITLSVFVYSSILASSTYMRCIKTYMVDNLR